MKRKLTLIAAFAMASLMTAATATASPSMCYAQYDAAVAECNGNSNCETQANINLGICLASLVDWIDDCDGRRC